MIQKICSSVTEALQDIADGSTILISGFGGAGLPIYLLDALVEQGAKELTLVSNNAGNQGVGIAKLIGAGRVKKMVCSFPRQPESGAFDDLYRAGKIELELVPQGTLAERIRAGGAGIGGFYTPTGFGTELAVGKDTRVIDGVNHIFEKAIKVFRWVSSTWRFGLHLLGLPVRSSLRISSSFFRRLINLWSWLESSKVCDLVISFRIFNASFWQPKLTL